MSSYDKKMKEQFGSGIKSTLRECSKDKNNQSSKNYMCESLIRVIDFDEVVKKFCRNKNIHIVSSNDAFLTCGKDSYFIEFKNGKISNPNSNKSSEEFYDPKKLKKKIYDSFIILEDIVGESLSSLIKNLHYILVYNEKKNPQTINDKISNSLRKKGIEKFGLEPFSGYLFQSVHTLTEVEFENQFLKEWEKIFKEERG